MKKFIWKKIELDPTQKGTDYFLEKINKFFDLLHP
jgi:hypothetical protein